MTMILIAVRAAVALTVLALGLRASLDDATYLFRKPAKLAKAVLSMFVVMPAFAALLVAVLPLRPVVAVALMTLAASPVPPFLPRKALKLGGAGSYTVGLLVAASLLALVFVPLVDTRVSATAVAKVVTSVLAPLAVGIVIRYVAPEFAMRRVRLVSLVATGLLVASSLPVVFGSMPTILSLFGNATLLAIVAFVAVGLLTGHLLGGPERDHRTVLALTTSCRHPGVALVIASAGFSDRRLLLACLLLYVIVSIVASFPYVMWIKRKTARSRGYRHHRLLANDSGIIAHDRVSHRRGGA
jgi:BASS family bile acid:Na+ symporter